MGFSDWLFLMLVYLKLTEQIDWGWQYVALVPIISAYVEMKLSNK